MAEQQPPDTSSPITPKDVFQRSNMPSRWERITGVAPKTAPDRRYLAFVAARYRGDDRLPHPDALALPSEFHRRQVTQLRGWIAVVIAVLIAALGENAHLPVVTALACVVLVCALMSMIVVWHSTDSAIRHFETLRNRCELAESRLHSDPIHAQDAKTVNAMINCDEGTLTYCAAKIASEIEQDPAWETNNVGFVAIDLWDELTEVAASARQIAQDRERTEAFERGRLRDDPEVRAAIVEDNQHRRESIALLAARVHAFADYRDQVHRHGMTALREHHSLNRMVRLVADERAVDRLR
jgi:hypothetical protein